MTAAPNRWADLRPRVLSALAMVLVGATAIWAGGWAFAALVIVACALMIWELSSMTRADGADWSVALALVAGFSLLGITAFDTRFLLILLALPAVLGALLPRRDPAIFAVYAGLIMLTGFGLITLRNGMGIPVILWLVLVVAVSDVLGYFAGRILGGPKFWPAVSPKKTWSGTAAGWVGAALMGLVMVWQGMGGAGLIWLSPLLAFAGQMGDIAESAIKRRAGVKDASNLIPGHGGVLDRFDALVVVVVVVFLIAQVMPLPIGGQ